MRETHRAGRAAGSPFSWKRGRKMDRVPALGRQLPTRASLPALARSQSRTYMHTGECTQTHKGQDT